MSETQASTPESTRSGAARRAHLSLQRTLRLVAGVGFLAAPLTAGAIDPPEGDPQLGNYEVNNRGTTGDRFDGRDREAVLQGAERALSTLRIDGVRTTIPFHLRLLAHADFRAARYDVDFLNRSGLSSRE